MIHQTVSRVVRVNNTRILSELPLITLIESGLALFCFVVLGLLVKNSGQNFTKCG